MKRYTGTETVKPGLYFNARTVSFKSIDDEGPLPGTPETVYRRVPMLALLVAGPVLGLAYVVFLPFLGFALVGWLLGVKATRVAGEAARATVRVLKPGWEPSLAFLGRTRPVKKVVKESDEWVKTVRTRLDRGDRGGA